MFLWKIFLIVKFTTYMNFNVFLFKLRTIVIRKLKLISILFYKYLHVQCAWKCSVSQIQSSCSKPFQNILNYVGSAVTVLVRWGNQQHFCAATTFSLYLESLSGYLQDVPPNFTAGKKYIPKLHELGIRRKVREEQRFGEGTQEENWIFAFMKKKSVQNKINGLKKVKFLKRMFPSLLEASKINRRVTLFTRGRRAGIESGYGFNSNEDKISSK